MTGGQAIIRLPHCPISLLSHKVISHPVHFILCELEFFLPPVELCIGAKPMNPVDLYMSISDKMKKGPVTHIL